MGTVKKSMATITSRWFRRNVSQPCRRSATERWRPSKGYTKKEQFILKRLATKRKLLAFLRHHRHEIFDEEFQEELESISNCSVS